MQIRVNNRDPRLDNRDNIIDAHDGTLEYFNGRFYWYGTAYGERMALPIRIYFMCTVHQI